MAELGINFGHIFSKSLTVLNPLATVDKDIMNDTDLAGPLIFCLLFGGFLLLVGLLLEFQWLGVFFSPAEKILIHGLRAPLQSGKIHFGYIYGVAFTGTLGVYAILNLMAETTIDGWRTASVLGYCLLPMVTLSLLSSVLRLGGGPLSLILAATSVIWCTYSASTMFVTVLSMTSQRALVAYPVGLLYRLDRLRQPFPLFFFS